MAAWLMVIDDDRDNRELLAELLESEGYPVVSCASAAAAAQILDSRGRPAVVLCDVRLPDMPGPQFVNTMKGRPGFEEIPVIYVTGMSIHEARGLAAPVLVKPFDVDVLMTLISRHCGISDSPSAAVTA